jgi:hypothetical protein
MTPRACLKKIGPDLVQKVALQYQKYQESPSPKTRKDYLTWRLRIHLRCNVFMQRPLEIVNEAFELGLNDEEAGPLMWEYRG